MCSRMQRPLRCTPCPAWDSASSAAGECFSWQVAYETCHDTAMLAGHLPACWSAPNMPPSGHTFPLSRLNDKLLRDMAGALTASEMASLFKPVPFGEQRVTLWERAAQPEHAVLWDMFR